MQIVKKMRLPLETMHTRINNSLYDDTRNTRTESCNNDIISRFSDGLSLSRDVWIGRTYSNQRDDVIGAIAWCNFWKSMVIRQNAIEVISFDNKSTMADKFRQGLLRGLSDFGITIWETHSLDCAKSQKDAFAGEHADHNLFPFRSQFWLYRSHIPEMMEPRNQYIGSIVYMASGTAVKVDIEVIISADEERIYLTDDMHLRVQYAFQQNELVGDKHTDFYSCLSFLKSRVAAVEPLSLPRSDRRRFTRSDHYLPAVHVIKVRQLESASMNGSHISSRQYNWRWPVRAFVRKPNRRMKEQRPIWVSAHIRGPIDMPLKPHTPTVNLVNR